ncbi:helix-turn-helix domain-containing protein [Paracoccus sediminis]|uniref:Helix-turn-helix domain-containing protein n=1 Tax=Paracoccus sediminis TaxID=1214787 RepID=A0A238UKW6_9RHOB|nr:helix-turn-helix domain-containing protein [Paracoccus sediminis]TBN53164.1 helix-turn-helix domain-containing protein [Paracoccus sediminis]SNR22732.1 Helix-turn-helix domain-containing protein [Paracoccus sediminis]
MSHEATNWAIKQRGLKPTTKIVLWHLCDRFNPDYGCFPSQDRLAHDCEISRSTLNDHLGQLEAVGLLRRVPRLDPVTKRQLPTRYILGFEPGFAPVAVVPCPETGHGQDQGVESRDSTDVCDDDAMADALPCPDFGHGDEASPVSDFSAEPCPENAESRVRISDTNPVREPLSKPVKEEEGAQAREAISDEVFGDLLAALGLDPAALPGWWQGWPPRLHVQRWRDELGLTEAEIIAAAEASRQEHPKPPDGPKALDRAMQRAAQRKAEDAGRKRRKPKAAPASAAKPITDLPAFYAELVNSDRYLPVSAISNTMRDAMLARGLVTAQRLRERGVR